MAVALTVKIDQKDVRFIDRITQKLGSTLGGIMLTVATIAQTELYKSTIRLLNKTGRNRGAAGLAGSWKPTVVETSGGEYTVGVFSDLPYARIHEEGGTIAPKNGQALAIPLNPMRTEGQWPSDMGDQIKLGPLSKGGNRLLVDADSGEPLFVLVSQVTINPTGYIEAARQRALPQVRQMFGSKIADLVNEAVKGP